MLINDALKNEIAQSVKKSLAEDIGDGDITASLNNDLSHAKAEIVCREKMVLCGRLWVDEIYNQLDPNFDIKWMFDDGDFIEKNTIILHETIRRLIDAMIVDLIDETAAHVSRREAAA